MSNTNADAPSDRGPRASTNDVWAQYYAQNDPSAVLEINACEQTHLNVPIDALVRPMSPTFLNRGRLIKF